MNKPGLVLVRVNHLAPRLLSGVEPPGVTWEMAAQNTARSPFPSTLTFVLNRDSNSDEVDYEWFQHESGQGTDKSAEIYRTRARWKRENSLN